MAEVAFLGRNVLVQLRAWLHGLGLQAVEPLGASMVHYIHSEFDHAVAVSPQACEES